MFPACLRTKIPHSRLTPLALSLSLALAGCGLSGQNATQAQESNALPQQLATRPFAADTLYALLTAEIATQRGQLDTALANYYQEAYKTRDAGVTRRATLLAQYLHAGQATLDLAMLWSELEPQNPEPVYISGQYLLAFQRTDLALNQSRKLLEMDVQSLFVAIAMTAGAQSTESHDKLLVEYRALLKDHGKNSDLLLGTAILLEQMEDFDGSLACIDKVLAENNKNLQARLFEVEVLHRSGRPDKAIKRMAVLVEEDKTNERLRMQYARLLADQDLQKAREQFDLLASTRPMDEDLLLSRALVNYRLNDRVQAQDQFEQLLFLKRHTDTADFYLGELALANKEEGKALEHYRRVENGTEYLPATVRILNLMIQQNQRLEAQRWIAQQRRSHPELAVRLYLIEADILLQQNDAVRSLAALNEAVQRNPDKAELYYARSLLLDKQGDKKAAESDLRFVLQAQPDNVDALNALGYILSSDMSRLQEAQQLVSRALALRPDEPAIMDSMGWILYHMGRSDEALLRLKRAFELYQNDEVAAHLGEVLWSVNKKTEADKVWKQGLKIKPDSEAISETRKRLQVP